MNIRVLVYDDNKGRQDALKVLIGSTPDMTCVGTFDNCGNVVEEVERTEPHVVLMDIDMPTVNGIEGLKLIRRHAPHVLVVMQTVFEQDEKIFEAIRSGAHGYFLKKTTSAKLIEGIREVLNGGAPMTSIVARKVLHMFYNQNTVNPKNHFDLTERELEILSHLVKGLSYKMIADAAGITYHTVNSHCKKIYEKLHVHSATEAVAKAIEHRIV
jgi:DNA-binding NarL/FixJ family response regulator